MLGIEKSMLYSPRMVSVTTGSRTKHLITMLASRSLIVFEWFVAYGTWKSLIKGLE